MNRLVTKGIKLVFNSATNRKQVQQTEKGTNVGELFLPEDKTSSCVLDTLKAGKRGD